MCSTIEHKEHQSILTEFVSVVVSKVGIIGEASLEDCLEAVWFGRRCSAGRQGWLKSKAMISYPKELVEIYDKQTDKF